MIVCSCNVLSDADVRTALNAADTPRTAGQVYGCLGCSPQCGRCARTIKRIMNEALAACASGAGQSETCETDLIETGPATACGPNCKCCPASQHRD
jgi:bacterioferritin-associated ferredoxin